LTEQIADHTNGTIGALLNATFGNAPELLISVAALRSGFYRVVQLTMLGSMITNMIFVFGLSCLIGGLRWQVQDIRLTSGNVSVGMLLMATAGSLIPATLVLSGQFTNNNRQLNRIIGTETPSQEEVTLSRVNAAVMLIMYVCYIIFQLGTHKDEFDEQIEERTAQPNVFCRKLCSKMTTTNSTDTERLNSSTITSRGLKKRLSNNVLLREPTVNGFHDDDSVDEEEALLHHVNYYDESFTESIIDGRGGGFLSDSSERQKRRRRRIPVTNHKFDSMNGSATTHKNNHTVISLTKSFDSVPLLNDDLISMDGSHQHLHDHQPTRPHGPAVSMRVAVIWLFIITLCVSAISDILVDTIDAFAQRMNLSQVFTSMIIVPFFSNVAEQVSAFLFAYRNEMDLVVGVTIGSAIQIATFVLPGSVLIGYCLDRSMTLYFHSYETVCLLLCTLIVAAVLQGGTTNWLVGAMLLGVYVMFAAGIWFHEIENLSVNTEELLDAIH
jgi:Ca2+/H+ antiporter